jgi:hypothetical protein
MREEKTTADRLAAFSDAVFAVIVTVMVLELRAPDEPAFLALWPTAISYAVSYLSIAIIWINHHHLYAVRRSSDAQIDMDQLCPSFHGVAPALCDRMDCAHPACLIPCSVLRRAVRVHRRCLQRLRAPSISPCGRNAGVRAYAAYGEAPIARCPCELHDRYVGCDRRAARRFRSLKPLAVGRDGRLDDLDE